MATGRVVLSGPDGRLRDEFLPERLSQSQLIQLILQYASDIALPTGGKPGDVLGMGPDGKLAWITPQWGGTPTLTVVQDDSDVDMLLVSGPESLLTPDPEDPDYLLVAGTLDPNDSDYLLIG